MDFERRLRLLGNPHTRLGVTLNLLAPAEFQGNIRRSINPRCVSEDVPKMSECQ